jgi:hypothetical protein
MNYAVEYRNDAGHLCQDVVSAENESVAADKARLMFGSTAVVLVDQF